ncbi:MAG: hypothetical protein LBC77_03100 [Spirochaetaceae bacterium]|nr:hypothetical protein [Spirochaetaceae bacterium]
MINEDDMRFYDEGCIVKSAEDARHNAGKNTQSGIRKSTPAYAREK